MSAKKRAWLWVRYLMAWLMAGEWEYRYDFEANASYLRVRRGKVAHTRESGNGEYIVDYDRWGNVIGVEVLSVLPTQTVTTSSTNTAAVLDWKRRFPRKAS